MKCLLYIKYTCACKVCLLTCYNFFHIVPPKPSLPKRPDFLSSRVTSASRRIEFFNTSEDQADEDDVTQEASEQKAFEHNFGASIRKGAGAFSIVEIPDDTKIEEEQSGSVIVFI